MSYNKYSYTGGDPINRFDPHGAHWCDPELDADCPAPCDQFSSSFSPLPCFVPLPPPPAPVPVPGPDPASAKLPCDQSILGSLGLNLDYSQLLYKGGTQSAQDHIIERHMSGTVGVSQYYSDNFVTVQNANIYTFLFGSQTVQGNSVVFDVTFPQLLPGGNHIGKDPSGGETATNRLVLRSDCKTVVTSYPIPGVD